MKCQFSKYLIYSFFSILVLLSCQAKSSEQPLELTAGHTYVDCYIRYIENTNTLKVVAKFSTIEDSLTLRRIQLSKLPTFQGLTMTYNSRLKQYEFESFKAFEEKMAIAFTEKNGKTTKIEVEFSALEEISIENNPIYKSAGFLIDWKGKVLTDEEDLFITIQHPKSKPLQMNWIGMTKKSELFIRKEQLTSLNIGKGSIQLVKKQLAKVDFVDKLTGIVAIEYYTREIPLTIAE